MASPDAVIACHERVRHGRRQARRALRLRTGTCPARSRPTTRRRAAPAATASRRAPCCCTRRPIAASSAGSSARRGSGRPRWTGCWTRSSQVADAETRRFRAAPGDLALGNADAARAWLAAAEAVGAVELEPGSGSVITGRLNLRRLGNERRLAIEQRARAIERVRWEQLEAIERYADSNTCRRETPAAVLRRPRAAAPDRPLLRRARSAARRAAPWPAAGAGRAASTRSSRSPPRPSHPSDGPGSTASPAGSTRTATATVSTRCSASRAACARRRCGQRSAPPWPASGSPRPRAATRCCCRRAPVRAAPPKASRAGRAETRGPPPRPTWTMGLLDELRELAPGRGRRRASVPAYVVANDRALADIATRRPIRRARGCSRAAASAAPSSRATARPCCR